VVAPRSRFPVYAAIRAQDRSGVSAIADFQFPTLRSAQLNNRSLSRRSCLPNQASMV
jgi:hypothetical protein